MIERNVLGDTQVPVKNVYSVGQGLSFASDLGQHFNHPVDDHGSFFPVQVELVIQVSIQVFAFYEHLIFMLDVLKRIVLKVDVNFIDFGLKLGNFLFGSLFRCLEHSGRRHDSGRLVEALFALD